ncbi:MAG: GTP-binding protein, partial [Pseudomonadota bacterium]
MNDINNNLPIENIRNFTIIAHIDHGKSTLSDRLIERYKHENNIDYTIEQEQTLDSMDLEREKGITIKSQTVQLSYTDSRTNPQKKYKFNLIDTPGHDDFRYEIDRCLSSVEGSIIVVDAAQGIEAQTIQNTAKALKANHKFIIALNKIDLPAANIEKSTREILDFFGESTIIIPVSAKKGIGITELLHAIIDHLPAPKPNNESKLQALLIDSWYDDYLGVIGLVRVFSGRLTKNMQIQTLGVNQKHKITNVGRFLPKKDIIPSLTAGDIGFFTTGVKKLSSFKVGDTICEINNLLPAIAGFRPNQPVIFCGLYPENSSSYKSLCDSLDKLHLNDSSFIFSKETSLALGQGFRCGFLGLLHLEIIQQRLIREFNIDIITTMPNVSYQITKKHKTESQEITIDNAIEFPEQQLIE